MDALTDVTPAQFNLDRTRHAAPQIFEHLRELIISMSLTPGMVLSRAELALQYNISQTPVRDALIRLSEEGLVDVYPQHATVVSRIDVNLAQEAHFLRLSVEMEIARTLAAVADPALIERLRRLVSRQKAALEEKDLSGFALADQAFHRQMYEAAKVPHLFSLVRRHSGHLDRLRSLHLPAPGKALAVLADHDAILEAIAQGDSSLAEQSVRRHLSGTLANVEEIRTRHRDYLKN
ncbi:GntR family transcriptional regulator [Noviherbaspirillum aerium]|uniref:GntR family transcriptional regulator n=1 Tax=Noviherbaspirillum aerium TaxID=2588497 RepID=UPI00124C2E6B|nr:GntR family transcriptional regulator [Noviherbaspirillum aerium]